MLRVSERWRARYPLARVGVLSLENVVNPSSSEALESEKRTLERQLRSRYDGYDRAQLKGEPMLAAYDAYYRRFSKTYHVQLQLETVVLKGKPIAGPSALVEAMFMAELKNQLLTAGHDAAFLEGDLVADVASGEESYTQLGGREGRSKEGDMMISDDRGVLSTVLYGPDQRSRLRATTEGVVFTVYAPAGIERETVRGHLVDLQSYISLLSPDLSRRHLSVQPEQA